MLSTLFDMLCMYIQQAQALHDPYWAAVTKQQADRNEPGTEVHNHPHSPLPMSMILEFLPKSKLVQ